MNYLNLIKDNYSRREVVELLKNCSADKLRECERKGLIKLLPKDQQAYNKSYTKENVVQAHIIFELLDNGFDKDEVKRIIESGSDTEQQYQLLNKLSVNKSVEAVRNSKEQILSELMKGSKLDDSVKLQYQPNFELNYVPGLSGIGFTEYVDNLDQLRFERTFTDFYIGLLEGGAKNFMNDQPYKLVCTVKKENSYYKSDILNERTELLYKIDKLKQHNVNIDKMYFDILNYDFIDKLTCDFSNAETIEQLKKELTKKVEDYTVEKFQQNCIDEVVCNITDELDIHNLVGAIHHYVFYLDWEQTISENGIVENLNNYKERLLSKINDIKNKNDFDVLINDKEGIDGLVPYVDIIEQELEYSKLEESEDIYQVTWCAYRENSNSAFIDQELIELRLSNLVSSYFKDTSSRRISDYFMDSYVDVPVKDLQDMYLDNIKVAAIFNTSKEELEKNASNIIGMFSDELESFDLDVNEEEGFRIVFEAREDRLANQGKVEYPIK